MSKPLWVYLSQVIGAMYEETKGTEYLEACLDRKGRGSEWNRGPEEVLSLLLFHTTRKLDLNSALTAPGCEYYKISLGEGKPVGTENIAIAGHDAENIRIRKGAHGPEIYQEVVGVTQLDVDHGWLILGPDEADPKKMVVWTAYPGRITFMAKPEDLAKALEEAGDGGLVKDPEPFRGCAVKLVRRSRCPHPGGALRPEICDHCSDLDCRKAAVGY